MNESLEPQAPAAGGARSRQDALYRTAEAVLPGAGLGGYALPEGNLWFARVGGEVAGVVGLRPFGGDGRSHGCCEMKRLWVRPDFRGLGLGRRLAETTVAAARSAGYRSLCLDTLPMMARAHRLYASLGFREAAPYYHNPLDGVVYLELDLVAESVESA